MMIHHQLLPLNQLQMPQLLLPHIRIPPEDLVEHLCSFPCYSRPQKMCSSESLLTVRDWQAGNGRYAIGLTRFVPAEKF